jgi:chromosome segregation ATPase
MKKGPSELMAAAAELDEQLSRFEELSDSIQKAPMNSEKQLARASKAINEIVEVGEGLQAHLAALITAINHFREKQEIYAVAVQKRAQEFQERSRELEGLLLQYRGLGQRAQELNAHMQSLGEVGEDNNGGRASLFSQLPDLEQRVGELLSGAQMLFEQADSAGFTDLQHQADALRQQLQSIRNKLGLIRRSVPQA